MSGRNIAFVIVLVIIVSLLIVWNHHTSAGSPKLEQPESGLHIVKLQGVEDIFNMSRLDFAWIPAGIEGYPPAIHMADGDVLTVGEKLLFPYKAMDGTTPQIKAENARVTLNGVVVSLSLEDAAAWDWLRSASEQELKLLRFISCDDRLEPERMTVLKRVARVNPSIGLMLAPPLSVSEDSSATMTEVLPLFQPRLLVSERLCAQDDVEHCFPSLENVEAYWGGVDSGGDQKTRSRRISFLSQMPHLRRLHLPEWQPGDGPIPPDLKQLKSLSIATTDITDVSPILHLEGLEELRIVEGLKSIAGISQLKKLRKLALTGCKEITDLSPLAGLSLTWLSFPATVSQEKFEKAIKQQSELEVVELVRCENVKDLTCLETLADLQVLVIVETEIDNLEPLQKLKNLRLLVLDKKTCEEIPEKVEELEKALPDCVISAGAGFCLGSGWILLLVPVVTIVGVASAWRRNR